MIIIPVIQQMVRVSLRTVVIDVPTQDVISQDNVSGKVNAVICPRDRSAESDHSGGRLFHGHEPARPDYTALRAWPARFDEIYGAGEAERRHQQILDQQTDAWGIKVANVEIKHVDLNETMVRAIARQRRLNVNDAPRSYTRRANCRRHRRSRRRHEFCPSTPRPLQLRYLETLVAISSEKNSTIVFPLPMELLTPFLQAMVRKDE